MVDTEGTKEPKEEASGSASTGMGEEGAADSSAEDKKGVEERLDEFADRFSNAVGEGVKRLESAFEKGMKDIKDNPQFSKSKVRGFFTSSAGGSVLVVIGFVWLFYAIGLLDNPVFPALMIIVGFYLMHRYKSED